jgi:hypothetical protein
MKHLLAVVLFCLFSTLPLSAPDAPEHLAFTRSQLQARDFTKTTTDVHGLSLIQQYCTATLRHCTLQVPKGATHAPIADFVFVVTTDGLRWQEVFTGADPYLMGTIAPEQQLAYQNRYGATTPETRRAQLLPFFWSKLAKNGQIYGNRAYGNQMNVDNNLWFSYPGYNELFSGGPDDLRIWSNAKKQNPNTNVFEYLNKQAGIRGKVAAFGSWDAFPYILNENRAEFTVNAGFENRTDGPVNAEQVRLNALQHLIPANLHTGVRPDSLTWAFTKNYLQAAHPRVTLLGLGETDEYAHLGNYAGYLDAARHFDACLADLYQFIQNDPVYRGRSAILITTDHGRGNKDGWCNHHALVEGSDAIWCAVLAPNIQAKGEVKQPMQIWQKQMAQTIAHMLGFEFQCEHSVAGYVREIFE